MKVRIARDPDGWLAYLYIKRRPREWIYYVGTLDGRLTRGVTKGYKGWFS